jgi:hypothetical protein
MPLLPEIPNTNEPLLRDQPYKPDTEGDKVRIEWVKSRKAEYYDSDQFKTYKKRCERMKHLVNQSWEAGKKPHKYGFRFGIARAAQDNYTDALTDLFDLDEFVACTPLHGGKESQEYASQMQDFINNMLQGIGYKKTWWDRINYLPDYGWSPAYSDFVYQEGFQPIVNVKSQTQGGFSFDRKWTTILNQPKSMVLHPYNWWGNPNCSSDHQYQGYTVRCYLPQLLAMKQKVDDKGMPLYNLDAIDAIMQKMAKGESKADPHFTVAGDRDLVKSSDQKNAMPFTDVTVYTGTLEGCKGHDGDFNTYIIECCDGYMLRFAEDALSGMFSTMTHARTHPFRNSPFSRSFLDAIVPHQSINDLLMNLGIENQVDGMHRMWAYYADDLLDENELKHPRGLNSFLELRDKTSMVPKPLEFGQSAALKDMESLFGVLEHDRQRVSMSDQEIGIPGNGQGDTATQASILKSAGTKKIRACAKRISAGALIPEIRSLTMLALMHSTPDKLRITSRDGQIIQMTPEHVQQFLTGLDMQVNDNVTRDKWEEAARKAGFWGNALKMLGTLSQPEYAIRLIRREAREAGFKKDEIDEIVPEPQIPNLTPPLPPPGSGVPGGPGASFPPAAAPASPPPETVGAQDVLAA